jgi:two-component system sensor histidine kinase RpfC
MLKLKPNGLPVALLRQALATLKRAWRLLARNTDAPELEQGIIRTVAGLIVLAAFLFYAVKDNELANSELNVLAAVLLYVALGLGILVRILQKGGISPVRRYFGLFVDNLGITFFMASMGEAGAVMFGLYLFIIFGNGFRFGRRYLHVCQALSLVGFGLVFSLDPHWNSSRSVGFACFAAILVLPFYVSVLAGRITQARKRADDANQAKSRFVANVSHEMRTPLNGVIAMADVLRETNLNESQREIVETMTTSAHLLLAQIEDVLDVEKIEAGRVHIEARPFDMGRLLSSTVKVVLPQARYKGLAVNTEVEADAADWYVGDSHHLRQIVLNLLSNAVKFTERGEVTLRAKVTTTDNEWRTLRIEVQDTGIGIPIHKQSAIFEPFAQADDSITRVYGGTGLGTTIARHLIGLMGGSIGVASTFGVGSMFWIELKLLRSEPQGIDLADELSTNVRSQGTAQALAAAQSSKVRKLRGARILVAEDNPTNQRVTQLILESGGHAVTIVENGELALDALERGGFDLALFDLSMPIVSGLEALKLYRFSVARPIPILILSANVTTEIIAECGSAGAAEFIPKPLRASYLLDSIERYLVVDDRAVSVRPPTRSEDGPALVVVDTPAVDMAVLRDLENLSSDSTFVDRLIRGFKSDNERLISQISDALVQRKYEAVKDAAHALKGGAASIGAMQLTQFASRIEKLLPDALRIKAAQLTEELLSVSGRTLTMLDTYLEERIERKSQNPPAG